MIFNIETLEGGLKSEAANANQIKILAVKKMILPKQIQKQRADIPLGSSSTRMLFGGGINVPVLSSFDLHQFHESVY